MSLLDDIFPYLKFLNRFRDIERKTLATGHDRFETDVEHSYQLTMLAWFVVDHFNLDLDRTLVFKYALAHDLVETYAGDTPFWSAGGRDEEAKDKREAKALEKIQKQFSETFPDLVQTIETYEKEKKQGGEASFVYALDKLIPILNTYQDNGRTWREHYPDLTADKIIDVKKDLIKHSPHVEKIFNELVVLLRERKDELFADK